MKTFYQELDVNMLNNLLFHGIEHEVISFTGFSQNTKYYLVKVTLEEDKTNVFDNIVRTI